MRLAGTIADSHSAATLVDYLLTLGIHARAEADGGAWQIWIIDEDRVGEGKQILAEFTADPLNEKYRAAAKEADRLRREEVEKTLAAKRNVIRLGGSVGAYRGRRPVTMLLLAASSVVFALTDFGDYSSKPDVMSKFMMSGSTLTEAIRIAQLVDVTYALPEIRAGEYWRLFTPMLVHLSIVHFIFNMVWLVDFGTQIENRAGSLGFALLIVATDLATNFAQFYWEGPLFGGMSGVNYGLFGFIWMRAYFEPWKGYLIRQSTVVVQIAWLFLCMTGKMGPVANAGHVGGLAAGVAIGFAPTLWRRIFGK